MQLLLLCKQFSIRSIKNNKNKIFILPSFVLFLGFPGGSDGKESAFNAGDLGSIPGLRKSPGEGKGYPLQYSYLGNSIDRGTWRATVHEVPELDTTERFLLSLILSLKVLLSIYRTEFFLSIIFLLSDELLTFFPRDKSIGHKFH